MLAGHLLLLALTVESSRGVLTSDSSTAVLELLLLPLVQAVVVAATSGLAVGLAALRRRRRVPAG